MNYNELHANIRRKESFLCVGLDTDTDLLPIHLKNSKYPLFEFNKAVIDTTSEYAVAYKPNVAFYESEGVSGWEQLIMTVEYIRKKDPSLFIIADAKRGDIGNTVKKYAKAFFETMDFDAVTLSPYMGRDSVMPFLEYGDKWAIILALTSNNSAVDFEVVRNMENSEPLYKSVIMKASSWGSKDNIMFVVGATRPEKLMEIREYCPDNFLLVPGIGAQGGSLDKVASYGMNDTCGLIVNVSRSVIFAGQEEDFAIKAREAAAAIREEMRTLLR